MAIEGRYLNLDCGFLSSAHGLGIRIALSDPKFVWLHGAMAGLHHTPTKAKSRRSHVRFARKHWEGLSVMKGVLTLESRGCRARDRRASTSRTTSPKGKAAQLSTKFAVPMDGGIRSGADMLLAITLRAQVVLLGRSDAYGLAIAGREGIEATILAEF
ncbi:uncharacterized protein BXZ73DRAFT_81529 [Epithele typhae]|uniref:uncharacterized protein n=1 Tax=Epithele typhae TaxID=378194 RepID=UPI002007BCDB|nr:uncharacterized protein BXZ73DRAFT_81529 [Epithele typhae]KAH9914766.1 hypothetical protein BXZ73DRAFT_81529 [Epithele typhae]